MTKLWSRRTGVLLMITTVGALTGCGSGDQAKQKLAQANAEASQIVAAAKVEAAQALSSAQTEITSERGKLRDLQGKVSAAYAQLAQLRRQINGAERTVAKNTLRGSLAATAPRRARPAP